MRFWGYFFAAALILSHSTSEASCIVGLTGLWKNHMGQQSETSLGAHSVSILLKDGTRIQAAVINGQTLVHSGIPRFNLDDIFSIDVVRPLPTLIGGQAN